MKKILISAILFFAVPGPAAIVMKLSQKNVASGGQCTIENTIDVDLFRSDIDCDDGRHVSTIYDVKKQTSYFVDHKKKTYSETTIQDLKEIADHARANMTGKEREKMKHLNAPMTVQKTGSEKQVGKFKCQPLTKMRGSEKVGEVCTTSWATAGIQFSKYKKAVESWKNFTQTWQKDLGAGRDNSSQMEKGFLVQATEYNGTAVVRETTLTDLKEESVIDKSTPPKDYTKQLRPGPHLKK